MKRTVIVSPFLTVKGGHLYKESSMLQTLLEERGTQVVCFCSKQLHLAELWLNGVFRGNMFVPLFTVKRLVNLVKGTKQETIVRLSDLTEDKPTLKRYTKIVVALVDVLNVFYLNVISFFDAFKISSALKLDRDTTIIVQYTHQYFVFGLWVWLKLIRFKGTVLLCVELSPEKVYFNTIRWLFKNTAKVAVNADLKEQYEEGTYDDVYPLIPIPIVKFKRDTTDKIVFGFIGYFRRSRGVVTLAKAIELVSMDSSLKDRVEFVVQINLVLMEKETIDSLKTLERLEENGFLSLIRQPLSNEEYFKVLNKCDVIIVPHLVWPKDPSGVYSTASSGVLTETLCYEKLPLVSSGSSLDKECAVVFDAGNEQSLYEQIKSVAINGISDDMRQRISEKSKELLDVYGVDVFLRFFLKYT